MKSTTKKAHGWHCQESPPTDTYMILMSRTMEKSRGGCGRLIFVMSKFLQSIKKKKKKAHCTATGFLSSHKGTYITHYLVWSKDKKHIFP